MMRSLKFLLNESYVEQISQMMRSSFLGVFISHLFQYLLFSQSEICCDKLEIRGNPDKYGNLYMNRTLKGDLGFVKLELANTARTSIYWTTGGKNTGGGKRLDIEGKLKYIPLNFP